MHRTETRDSPPPHVARLYRVCWASVVGDCTGRGRPLPREVAEFIARDEALANPMRSYWVEEWAIGTEGADDREQVMRRPRVS